MPPNMDLKKIMSIECQHDKPWKGYKPNDDDTVFAKCGECNEWVKTKLHTSKADALYLATILRQESRHKKMMKKFRGTK